ncbi:MAG: GDSL-type esterase/lipase family protein [Chitinophagaceae bacterium]
MIKYLCTFTLVLSFLSLCGQPIPVKDNVSTARYPFINTIFNRVLNNTPLDSFYQKLYRLKTTGQGNVSVVHIGDSHIQADFLSNEVRDGFQDFFGNAGRGLVFPYQLAKSNAPSDIISSSNTSWSYNRIAHPELGQPVGVSGFGIRTMVDGASINLAIRPDFTRGYQGFNKLKFFLDSTAGNGWMLDVEPNETPYMIRREQGDTSIYQEVDLSRPGTGFTLVSLPGRAQHDFYGVSLENSSPGVIYHSIGVNGARYDQYNNATLFWHQLPALNADLYIVSLGTNEAQRAAFAETAFLQEFNQFIDKLRMASPHASILVTTAPDSYKGRYSNKVLKALNTSLTKEANRLYLPCWDLYKITNGFGSAYSWSRRGLMSRDRIHFTAEGYRLQGQLLFNALAKGYNDYIESLQPRKLSEAGY